MRREHDYRGPEHHGPEFDLLARIVWERDAAMDAAADKDAVYEQTVSGTIPVAVLSYVAVQRAMRGLGIETLGDLQPMSAQVAGAAAAWIDGFMAGATYERKRETTQANRAVQRSEAPKSKEGKKLTQDHHGPLGREMTEQQTWTFFGHWEEDRIVVEYVLPGIEEDERIDVGYWEQGLWAASGSGATMAEAQAAVIAEYEEN